MKSPEYRKGPEVREEFERTMSTLFRAPKPKERKQPKAATSRKTKDIIAFTMIFLHPSSLWMRGSAGLVTRNPGVR